MNNQNPLSNYFRTPKLYTTVPSRGAFYSPEVMDYDEQTGELSVFAMTARDEMIMKNPDALLNGDAVAQVIRSCVPAVKKPRDLISADVDTLLVAIQGATYGDEVEVNATCPECGNTVSGAASIDASLQSMTFIDNDNPVTLDNGLTIHLRPVTYDTTVKAGVTSFQTTRSLQAIANIEDEMEQLRAFNTSYTRMAALNFEILVDSVQSITGVDADGEEFVVQDRPSIREFLENCENTVGKRITAGVETISNAGINKSAKVMCQSCEHMFETEVSFDPVNFFTAS